METFLFVSANFTLKLKLKLKIKKLYHNVVV